MWIHEGKEIRSLKDIPKDAIGFIYEIQDEEGMKYIGRKSLKSVTRPIIAKSTYDRLKKEGEPVTKTKNKKKDRKSTRLNSSHVAISYAVFCLKKKKKK